jgi:hypothetical protein
MSVYFNGHSVAGHELTTPEKEFPNTYILIHRGHTWDDVILSVAPEMPIWAQSV